MKFNPLPGLSVGRRPDVSNHDLVTVDDDVAHIYLHVGEAFEQQFGLFGRFRKVDRDAFLSIMVDVPRRDVALNGGGILLVNKISKCRTMNSLISCGVDGTAC